MIIPPICFRTHRAFRTIGYNGGNPTNWYNGETYSNLTWEQGRRLSSVIKGTGSSTSSISYTYDMSGIRSSKTVSSVTHNYVTQSGRVVRESYDNKVLDFFYDANGRPFALDYSANDGTNFTKYYYVLNAQGDVVGLMDRDGNLIVKYAYDAWGKLLSVTDATGAAITASTHIANINPLRYRGYYYDADTGWYYLQSRFYDPIVKRFLNADTFASTGQGFLGYNMYAYCENNPVNAEDETGELWNFVFGAAVGAAVGFASTVVSEFSENGWSAFADGKTYAKAAVSSITGAIGGMVAASGISIIGAGFAGGVLGAVESVGHQLIDTGEVDEHKVALDAINGAIGGMLGGKGACRGDKVMARQCGRFAAHLESDGMKQAAVFLKKMTWNYSKRFSGKVFAGIMKSTVGNKISQRVLHALT